MKIYKKILILLIILIINNKIFANNIKFKNIKNVKSYILIDYYSEKILAKKNINLKLPPASLTKIMTSYIISDYIKNNKIKLKDIVTIGYNSWYKNPIFKNSSLMFLIKDQKVKISDLNKGIIIQSGNDACVAISEYIAGNEKKFVKLMNKYSKKMNLKNTNFTNSHGLDNNNHYSTSLDIAKLSINLIKKFPNTYKIYKKKEFIFNKINQKNRNNLLWYKKLNVDGIKTGHTDKSGYNLVSSAKKNNTRLITVILGAKSIEDRDNYTKQLLNWGFKNFETKKLIDKNKIIKYKKIYFGKNNFVPIGINKDLYITYSIKKKNNKKIITKYFKKIEAPINKNKILGKILIKENNKKLNKKIFLISLKKINLGNIIKIIIDYIIIKINYIIYKIKKIINILKNE